MVKVDKTVKVERPKPRYQSRVEYDFLKYIRVIMKWASDNYDLSKPDIEFLLYLYGQGAFTRTQFNKYHRIISLYPNKTVKRYLEDGWIRVWRPKKGKQHAVYTLTQKAKIMCNKMHRFACGVEEIPTDSKSNEMGKSDKPRINKYYMDVIKKMNKDKAED